MYRVYVTHGFEMDSSWRHNTDFQNPNTFPSFSNRAWDPEEIIRKSFPTKSQQKNWTNNAFCSLLAVTKCYLHTFNIELTGMISKFYKKRETLQIIRRYTNCIKHKGSVVLVEKSSQYPLVEMFYKNVSHWSISVFNQLSVPDVCPRSIRSQDFRLLYHPPSDWI